MKMEPLTIRQKIVALLNKSGVPLRLGDIVDQLGEKYRSVQQELQRRGADIWRIGRGLYTTPDIANELGLKSVDDASGDVESNSPGNAGIIFIDADTGKEFFVVEFPPYLRVINPYEVVLRPRSAGDAKPDANDFKNESLEEPS